MNDEMKNLMLELATDEERIAVLLKEALGDMANGNFGEALEYFDSIISMKGDEANYYYYRAKCNIALEQLDLAIKDFDILVDLKPNEASYYKERGVLYVHIYEYLKDLSYLDQAIENLNVSIKLEPDKVESYLTVANVYLILEKYMSVIQALTIAKSIEPFNLKVIELTRKAITNWQKQINHLPNGNLKKEQQQLLNNITYN